MELLAPAGNFDVAIWAFDAGADAVYLGLKNYSARKRADNFDYDDLRRLKYYAKQNRKKIFVTLNTLVKDAEWGELSSVLQSLVDIDIDAVIVQDIGLALLIHTYFPSLEIHASTQMAIHSLEGAIQAKKMGITRVVLARECTFDTISAIRQAVPDLQLEIFIHGALCYSFSGLCLASGMLLDRSGNRGECAQICRTYFTNDKNESSYPFSCNDLAVRAEIVKLQALGICSFKIEGRMKSAEYVHSTVSYYRQMLVGDQRSDLLVKSQLSFARQLTYGYLRQSQGEQLINRAYAGHLGQFVGVMADVARQLRLLAEEELLLFDTLAFFRNGELVTRCQLKRPIVKGRRVETIKKNDAVIFELPAEVKAGDRVHLVGRSEKALHKADYKKYPMYTIDLTLSISVKDNGIILRSGEWSWQKEVTWQERSGEKTFIEAFQEQLNRSADSLYHLVLRNDGDVDLANRVFLPPSTLKDWRRELYALNWSTIIRPQADYPLLTKSFRSLSAPQTRSLLQLADGMPFVQDESDLTFELLGQWEKYTVIPLSPILFDEENYYRAIEKFIHVHPDHAFLLGINNLAHLSLVEKLSSAVNCSFYVDYGLYIANQSTLAFCLERVPGLLFAYSWCESKEVVPGCVSVGDRSGLPLFLSRGCYLKHRGQSCLQCQKQHSEELVNGKNRFRVRVKRCLTYLFQVDRE